MLLALCSASAWAQARRITGVVTAENGEPLGIASVSVRGTALGAITAETGRFSVPAPEGTVTLRVRRIGYRETTVVVNAGQNDVTVKLTKDVLQLEKQVITGQATSIASRNSANAVTVIGGEQLNRAPTPTVENALQGKIAGAIITERVFSWPGVGSLLVDSISERDYKLTQGCILIIAATYVLVNSATDIVYRFLDPRIKVD